jgi:hypothetical protein
VFSGEAANTDLIAIIEILLKVALNTINQPNKPMHKTLHLDCWNLLNHD